MIEKMEKVYIYSLKEQTTGIMEEVLKCGVLQPEKTESMVPEDAEGILKKGKSLDLSREEALLERIGNSISSLKNFGNKRGILYKRPVIAYDRLKSEKVLTDSIAACEKVEAVTGRLERLVKRQEGLSFEESSLIPWEAFELPAEELRTES